MDYAEAADHAESLFFAKNAIGKAVVSARMQQRAERLEFDMRTGGDSTARLAIQAVTPLAAVRCIYLGQAFWFTSRKNGWMLWNVRFFCFGSGLVTSLIRRFSTGMYTIGRSAKSPLWMRLARRCTRSAAAHSLTAYSCWRFKKGCSGLT